MFDLVVFALVAAPFVIVPLIVALVLAISARSDVDLLRRRVERAEAELRTLRDARAPNAPAAATPPEALSTPATVTNPPVAEPADGERQATAPAARTAGVPSAPEGRRLEEQLTGRWLVWLGGLALAMGGVFLVKVSFDRGWITPELRMLLGIAVAIALIAAGEWLRARRSGGRDAGAAGYVPAALVAGGLATGFGTVFAAHRLYVLIDPTMAFATLAALSLIGIGLALRHNVFVALVGLVGGYAVPMLVESATPNPAALYSYLAVVGGAVAWVTRLRAWWRVVAPVDLTLAAIWCFIGLAGLAGAGASPWVAAFAAYLALLRFALREGCDEAAAGGPRLVVLLPLRAPNIVALAGGALACLVLVLLAAKGAIAIAELGALFVLAAGALAIARRAPRLEALPILAAGAALIVLVKFALATPPFDGTTPLPIAWLDLASAPGLIFLLAFALLFALAGFAFLWGAARPGYWAAISGFVPPIYLAVVHHAAFGVGGDAFWTALALGTSGLLVAAAGAVARYRDHSSYEAALGAYALSAAGAVVLALAILFAKAWLTVALAGEIAAIVWIAGSVRVPALRWAALALAAAVFARLVLNPAIAQYPIGAAPLWNWMLYGYGAPIAAFLLAARRFGGWLAIVLDAGALVLAVVLIGLEIRTVAGAGGRFDGAIYGLFEQALHSIAWLGMAYVLLRWSRSNANPVLRYGWRFLFVLGLGHLVLFPVLVSNPLAPAQWTGSRAVGELAILNLLAVAYALPALLCLATAFAARRVQREIAVSAAIASLALTLIWLTLEVRRAFHGSDLRLGTTGDLEWYAYSAAWLIFGGLLLAIGILRRSAMLRWASLAVVMLAVAKVFVWDMSALTGLYRALSLLCLGLALVGIGYLYQRFVFPRPAVPAAA